MMLDTNSNQYICGYIWQKREKREEELPSAYPDEFRDLVDRLNELTKTPEIEEPMSYKIEKARRDREYHTKLMQELRKNGATIKDIDTLNNDPIMNALRNLKDMNEAEKEKVYANQPELVDLSEAIEDARDSIADRLERSLDSPAQRFLDDVATIVSALASLYPPTRSAAMAYAGARATVVAIAPKLRLIAPAFGAAAIAGYDKIRTFFSENFGSDGKDKGKADSSSERIQSTRQDADRYLDGLKEKNVLGDRKQSLDGREYYEFQQKINHNGVRFRKGDYISRDTLHHEWEWFRGPKSHRGAIESKTGKFDPGKRDSSRKLRIKS